MLAEFLRVKLHGEKEKIYEYVMNNDRMNSNKGVWILVLVSVFLGVGATLASAATISGTIYDFNLVPVHGAVLSINTSPEQIIVSDDGLYSLSLATGVYEVKVSKIERAGLSAVDSAVFVIESDGSFTHDFILFEQAEDVEIPQLSDEEKGVGPVLFHPVLIAVFVLALIVFAVFAFMAQKRDEKSPPLEEDEVLREIGFYIKKHKRVSQKEIRLQFPYSESSVSMAVSHLESEGYVKKIKKGRANIIIWEGKKNIS